VASLALAAGTADRASPPIDLGELAEVARSFERASDRLRDSHAALEEETRRLRRELAEARAQLERSRELAALGELAAGIAHEIRNPLGAIALQADLLHAAVAAEDGAPRRQCEAIRAGVRRIESIVADVLRFAREGRLERQAIEVRLAVDDALRDCAAALAAAGVRVETALDASVADIDRGLCAQAIANLVRNAVEAMAATPADERRVRIELRRERRSDARGRRRERVTIAVEDRGPGLPDGEFARIFRPFVSLRPSGTGLGLAIVHRIVDAHGGQVVARNLAAGARFELSLPVRAADRSDRPDPVDGAVRRRLARRRPSEAA